jgi:hypothetical protein
MEMKNSWGEVGIPLIARHRADGGGQIAGDTGWVESVHGLIVRYYGELLCKIEPGN